MCDNRKQLLMAKSKRLSTIQRTRTGLPYGKSKNEGPYKTSLAELKDSCRSIFSGTPSVDTRTRVRNEESPFISFDLNRLIKT